mgnify:CR=1
DLIVNGFGHSQSFHKCRAMMIGANKIPAISGVKKIFCENLFV